MLSFDLEKNTRYCLPAFPQSLPEVSRSCMAANRHLQIMCLDSLTYSTDVVSAEPSIMLLYLSANSLRHLLFSIEKFSAEGTLKPEYLSSVTTYREGVPSPQPKDSLGPTPVA